MLKIIISLLLLSQATVAMQIRVQNMTCEEKSITVDFDRLCTNESVCTVGKAANLVGSLTYHYLNEEFGMNQSSKVYLNLNMSLFGREAASKNFSVHKPIYEGTFFDFVELPLCDNATLIADSDDAECPGTGTYKFTNSIKLPHPNNAFQTWMFTGYDGLVKLGIYQSEQYDSEPLGSCTFYVTTEQGQSRLGNLPNGKPVHDAVITFVAVFLWLAAFAVCCLVRRQRNRKHVEAQEVQKVVRPRPLTPEEKVEGRFRRLEEETQEEQHRTFAFRYVPPEDDPVPPSAFERACLA
ncbi:unnamed protein product [Cylindrotheca closterium]|uniref:Uncharacterized protein n=1 Tax=Cylindrotheca closterium TaxID=2856 RepID=A0AAD2G0G7_9STRA|nr:unnamed protein product [Cylindrotheca closterium]